MTDVFYYRVWCTVENNWQYIWAAVPPTVCPTDATHAIDPIKTSILDKNVNNPAVTPDGILLSHITEETIGKETGGHFGAESINFTAAVNTTTTKDIVPVIPIALLSAQIQVKGLTDGDKLAVHIAPDTIVGTLDVDAGAASTVLTLPQSVIDLFTADTLFIGQSVKLDDGTNIDSCGTITAFDATAKTITVATGTTNAFLAATPTLIKITTSMTPNILGQGYVELKDAQHAIINVGEDKIGGSRIEAGSIIRVTYTNTSATLVPNVVFIFSYLY